MSAMARSVRCQSSQATKKAVAMETAGGAQAGHAVRGDLESVRVSHESIRRNPRAIDLVQLVTGSALTIVLPDHQILPAIKRDPRRGLTTGVSADGDSAAVEHLARVAHPRAEDVVLCCAVGPFVRPHHEVTVAVGHDRRLFLVIWSWNICRPRRQDGAQDRD